MSAIFGAVAAVAHRRKRGRLGMVLFAKIYLAVLFGGCFLLAWFLR